MIHTPVLMKESCEYLITDPAGKYFDATAGFGGHSSEFLKYLNNKAVLIASDVDEAAFSSSQKRFADDERVKLYRFNFSKIDIMAKLEDVEGFTGIFADLGVSSFQLDDPDEGFSFRNNSLMDLRLDKTLPNTASSLLNSLSETELSDIFFRYGEEKNSRKIARRIVEAQKTGRDWYSRDIEEIVKSLVPPIYVRKTMQRVFQALRIYINDELGVLKEFIEKAVDLLLPGGRIVIISYHSLEDRMVKESFRYEETSCICPPGFPICTCGKTRRLKVITRKPIVPNEEEIEANYRSRSAKLRVAEKV